MEQEIEWLKNRVSVLEEFVECLIGKALADSGQMELLLKDVVAMNQVPPISGETKVIDDRLHVARHMRERLAGGEFRSTYFPRKWKQARRLRETLGFQSPSGR